MSDDTLTPKKTSDFRTLLIWGTVFLLVGLSCLYVFGYLPWREAMDREPTVTLSFKGLIFSPLFILLGGLMLAPIKALPPSDPAPGAQVPTPWRVRIFFAALVLSEIGIIAYFFWLRAFLQGQGYDV
jgi:hypothetical protein